MNSVKQLFEQLRGVHDNMSVRARVVSAAVILAVLGGLGYVILADHTSYAPLYTGLNTEDASRIAEQLRKEKVPFRIGAGGSALLVPEESVHETRLSLAGQGLPRGGGVGFEIFDKQKFGASELVQQVNYRRGLQGELSRTIAELDAVKSARVHVAMPKRQLFARKRRPVSASVTLRMRSGRTLGQGAVKAIVHMVSSAVSGLSPDAVTVVSTAGKMLWSGNAGGAVGPGRALEYRKSIEELLERRVTELVNAAVGPGHSVVKISAEVALTRIEQLDTEFDPDKAVVRSESTLEEKNADNGRKTGGVPGVKGNLPGGPRPTAGASAGGTSRKRATRNYDINKTVRRKVSPAGEVRRLSVAVLVDSKILDSGAAGGLAGGAKDKGKGKGKGEGEGKGEGKTRAAAAVDLGTLEDLVKNAVGYVSSRGDTVSVKAVPFAGDQLPAATPPPWPVRVMQEQGSWLIPVAALAAVGIVVLVIVLRRRRTRPGDEIELPTTVQELEARGGGAPLALGEGDRAGRDLASAAAEHDARRAAAVLRAWIAES